MNKEIQYEIYIGCDDQQTKKEIVSVNELRELVQKYFTKKQINYSILEVNGGYLHQDNIYDFENTLCITIIGNQSLDIIKLAKSLSMYMNQECFLITKNELTMEYC